MKPAEMPTWHSRNNIFPYKGGSRPSLFCCAGILADLPGSALAGRRTYRLTMKTKMVMLKNLDLLVFRKNTIRKTGALLDIPSKKRYNSPI